jgi:2-dehydropantoate 2-reductase
LLWSKLCFLGPFALVTSASGMNKGEIYADAEWKRKLISTMAEACAVAKASGAEVEPGQIQAIYDGLPSGIRSSMQKDLAAKRQLELDAIGGPIVRGGEHYGIDVSTTAALVHAVASVAPATSFNRRFHSQQFRRHRTAEVTLADCSALEIHNAAVT